MQRTVNRSLIVHADFCRGYGPVVQTRGENTAAEQKVELDWIFRTADEIRYLNQSLYTRVALHTEGPLIHYAFDITSNAVDDGWDVLAPLPVVTFGRWLRTGAAAKVYTSDTTNLTDITNAINTDVYKEVGFMVFNTTTNKPVWAIGSADGDVWKDATGATAHTPV